MASFADSLDQGTGDRGQGTGDRGQERILMASFADSLDQLFCFLL